MSHYTWSYYKVSFLSYMIWYSCRGILFHEATPLPLELASSPGEECMNHIPFVCEHEKRDECVCHICAMRPTWQASLLPTVTTFRKGVQHGLSLLLEESRESRCCMWDYSTGFNPNHCRKADHEQKWQKWAATHDAYVANCLRMAARRALE